MVNQSEIVEKLDEFFEVKKLSEDPSMKTFLPMVYDSISFDWKNFFEEDFTKRFNGLMIKGNENVSKVFASSFPQDDILRKFIQQSEIGDLLFIHHPIPMECGDPENGLGRGFLPMSLKLLNEIKEKELSVYSCHAPLDNNRNVGTNASIAESLDATVESEFLPYGNGYAGLIAKIYPISTKELIEKIKIIFNIPYVDFAGKEVEQITKIGIVAGGGDDAEYFKEVKEKGVQAYISGEIFSRVNNDWAKNNNAKIEEYIKTTDLSLIGVSHSASEFLVMRTQFSKWIKENLGLEIIPLAQDKWWK